MPGCRARRRAWRDADGAVRCSEVARTGKTRRRLERDRLRRVESGEPAGSFSLLGPSRENGWVSSLCTHVVCLVRWLPMPSSLDVGANQGDRIGACK